MPAAAHEPSLTAHMSRLAEPQEAAEAVWFLATEASSFVTGTDLLVDGGLSIG